MEVRTIRSAASCSSSEPTSVDPVKDRFRTRGSWSIALTRGPAGDATTTLTTPAGTPARSQTDAIASAVSGVSVAGLITTVQPAARAGATLRVIIAAGKFH